MGSKEHAPLLTQSPPAAPAATTYPQQNQVAGQYYNTIEQAAGLPNYAQQAYNTFAPSVTGSYNPQQGIDQANSIWSAANSFAPSELTGLQQSGFDPQQALYARTQQQVQDQTRAGLEARGVDMTPYGAGIEGQTMSNFNIDWQNQQLQRQIAAAQAQQGLLDSYAKSGLFSSQIGQGVPASQLSLLQGLQGAGSNIPSFINAAASPLQGYGTTAGGQTAQNYNLGLADYTAFANNLNEGLKAANPPQQSSPFGGLGQLFGQVGSAPAGSIFGKLATYLPTVAAAA
jgi:hypothetical protein